MWHSLPNLNNLNLYIIQLIIVLIIKATWCESDSFNKHNILLILQREYTSVS